MVLKTLLPHKVTSLECYYFYYARAYVRNGSNANDVSINTELLHVPFVQ